MDEALKDLWNAAGAGAPFNTTFGIVVFWTNHYKELGSPVGPEHVVGAGMAFQAFSRGIVKWDPAVGATIL